MRTHVILHIGELVEPLVADFALHLLILTASLLVDYLHSPPQFFFFFDDLVFETGNLRGGIVFSHIFCSRRFKNLRANHSIWADDMLSLESANTLEDSRA